MNEKLTTKQREWIHDEAWAKFEYAEIDGQTRNVITLTQLFEILTAHTAEDVCPGCGYRYQYVDGTPAPCPQCITAEEQPTDEDKLKYLKQKFATSAENWRKLETQITLRKIEECRVEASKELGVELAIEDLDIMDVIDWLQQEDK